MHMQHCGTWNLNLLNNTWQTYSLSQLFHDLPDNSNDLLDAKLLHSIF